MVASKTWEKWWEIVYTGWRCLGILHTTSTAFCRYSYELAFRRNNGIWRARWMKSRWDYTVDTYSYIFLLAHHLSPNRRFETGIVTYIKVPKPQNTPSNKKLRKNRRCLSWSWVIFLPRYQQQKRSLWIPVETDGPYLKLHSWHYLLLGWWSLLIRLVCHHHFVIFCSHLLYFHRFFLNFSYSYFKLLLKINLL